MSDPGNKENKKKHSFTENINNLTQIIYDCRIETEEKQLEIVQKAVEDFNSENKQTTTIPAIQLARIGVGNSMLEIAAFSRLSPSVLKFLVQQGGLQNPDTTVFKPMVSKNYKNHNPNKLIKDLIEQRRALCTEQKPNSQATSYSPGSVSPG